MAECSVTTEDLTYPFSPNAEWKFAVSRKFNEPAVDRLYSSVLLPVLQAEGLVIECSHASGKTEDQDYWINRMDIIFELTDIHVLIDINTSPSVEFEIERANCLSRHRRFLALNTNFQWGFTCNTVLLSSYRIFIRNDPGRDSRSCLTRKTILHARIDSTPEELSCRLKSAIHWAKRQRLKRLNRFISFFEKRVRLFGLPSQEVEFALTKMTELAKRIRNSEPVDDLVRSADASALDNQAQLVLNKTFEWRLKLKSGEMEIPDGFKDTQLLIRDYYLEGLSSMFHPKFSDHWIVRGIAWFGALVEAFKIRRQQARRQTK